VLAAYRKQNWSAAAAALDACRQKLNGLDMAAFCELYEARIEEFKLNPPPPDWDGVATMRTK
jgi:adenylate cyclase